MKNHILRLFLVVFAMGTIFVGVSHAQSSSGYAGTWYSASAGTTISVSEKDGFVDVLGKDDASIYSCSGIIERSVEGTFVECYGSGMNHVINQRFFYKSRLKMIEKGQVMEETWEARFANGNEIKKITGDSTFRRKKPETKRQALGN